MKTDIAWHARCDRLPTLRQERTTLREIQLTDEGSLLPLLQDPAVSRFVPHAPTTPREFDRFVSWAHGERQRGRHVCMALATKRQAVGLLQAWPLETSGRTIEWGFALGRPYWGQGLFHEAARAFVQFLIRDLGVERLEARAARSNVRGTAALQRLGAQCEGVLRQCFTVEGERADYLMWSILATDWREDTRKVSTADAAIDSPTVF